MKYDFETLLERRGTSSCKWDEAKENELPMWVADMDFPVAPKIREKLIERLNKPGYGYTFPEDGWSNAYISFWRDMYGYEIPKESIMFVTGVVPAISSSVRKLTNVGDKIILLTPCYNIFFNSIVNNGRIALEVPLLYEDYKYSIDFSSLEEAMKREDVTMLILCNPQNPIGRIWSKEELIKIASLAKKYNVYVLSDEIHSQIVKKGKKYVPFASVSKEAEEISINCISPTKTFNLAGINTAAIFCPNEDIRKKVNRQINTDEVAEPNIFACIASETAFNECRDWMDEMNETIESNYNYVKDFVETNLPKLRFIEEDATYLLWIDVSEYGLTSDEFIKELRDYNGLWLCSGSSYGKSGEGFIRINIATQLERVKDGMNRLKEFIKHIEQ